MNNKKIFITGSSGFIGRNLSERYSQSNDIFHYRKNDNIKQNLKDFKPDIIFNCAAEIYDDDKMFSSNVLLVNEILDFCKNNHVEHLIQFGSSSEYGESKDPMSEKMRLNPRTIYEGTKAAATMLCLSYSCHYAIQATVIRPFSVFGLHEKPHRLFPKLAEHFFKNKNLTLNNAYHDFIYIKDFLTGVDKVLSCDKKISKGDVVNIGSGFQYSNFDVLDKFESVFGVKSCAEKRTDMAKKFETENWVCDTSYFSNRYNFKPEFSLENGIKDYITEYAKYNEIKT